MPRLERDTGQRQGWHRQTTKEYHPLKPIDCLGRVWPELRCLFGRYGWTGPATSWLRVLFLAERVWLISFDMCSVGSLQPPHTLYICQVHNYPPQCKHGSMCAATLPMHGRKQVHASQIFSRDKTNRY